MIDTPALSVQGLTTEFPHRDQAVRAVDDVSFDVRRGEVVGVVGESGSGKTTLARSLLRLVPSSGRIVSGKIILAGTDLLELPASAMATVRGRRIALIPQNPMRALHPCFTVGWQLREAISSHDQAVRGDEAAKRAADALDRMGVPDAQRRLQDYPHEFSGGMQQRVMIAMALMNSPELLIADEPTTALDVTIQAQILALFRELAGHDGMAIIFVTHNLGVVAGLCDSVMVMYDGQAVETGPVDSVFSTPQHPYTRALLDSLPERADGPRLRGISYSSSSKSGTGCRFRPRCPIAESVCEREPELR